MALNECLIQTIEFPTEEESGGEQIEAIKWFPSMTMLQLSSCKVDNWASVEALNSLSTLKHLKFKFNPILESESPETCRQLMIASITSLTYLNGSQIEKQERRGAEVDYLKKYGKEYLAKKDEPELMKVFSRQHPR